MEKKPTYEELELTIAQLEKSLSHLKNQRPSDAPVRALLETSDDGIMVTDEKGIPQVFNSAYAKAIKDALGIDMKPGIRPGTYLQDPKAIELFQKATERALKGERFRLEYSHAYGNGQFRYFEFSFCPVRVDGKITGFTQISRDITDRVKALKSLEEKEKLLSHSERIIGMGSFIWDLKTNEVLWSDNMYRIQGVPEEEIQKKPIKINPEIIHPDDRATAIKQIARMIESRNISTMEFRILPPDGKERKIRWNGEIEYDENGKPSKFYGVYHDITEAAKAKDDLAERNTFIETVLNNLPIGVAVTRLSTGISSLINKKFEEIYGWPKNEIPDLRSFFQRVYPDTEYRRKVRKKVVEDVLSRDFSRMNWEDLNVTTKTGEKRLISTLTIPLFDQDLIISTAMDTTEASNMMESLRQSEERYKALFDRSFESICIYDLDGRFIDANQAYLDLVEYAKEDFLGLEPLDIIAPVSRAAFLKTRASLLRKGVEENVSEYQILSKSGTVKTVEMKRMLILRNEEPYAIQSFIRDITHEKLFEEQLRHTQKMESIGTLAGGIAHDFNNILGIILGNTELALEKTPDENPLRRFLFEIRTACIRGRDVVKQLLGFSQKAERPLKPANIKPILEESIKKFTRKAPPGVEIITHLPTTSLFFLADAKDIHQLLQELYENALEAVGNKGCIEVAAESVSLENQPHSIVPEMPPGSYLKVTVKDDGTGILPENLSRIFDPYFTTKETGKGSGMGLAIVHGIIKSHNGFIHVESSPGKGSVFSLFIPLVSPPARSKAAPSPLTGLPGGHERILFVDDEEALLAVGEKMLELLGYEVETHTDPMEALKRFSADPGRYDLVITDLSMPDLSGDELAKRVLAIRPDIPVILCSGYVGGFSEMETWDIDLKAVLAKPFNHADIAVCVRKTLDGKF